MSRESTKARRPARRRVFVADPPLASLVDEAVAQLKIPPQYPTHRRRNRGLLLGLRLSHRLVAVRLAPRPWTARHRVASHAVCAPVLVTPSVRLAGLLDGRVNQFLGAQNTRPTTIEMTENPEAEDEGVLWAKSSASTAGTSRSAVPPLEHPKCKGGTDGPTVGGTTPVRVAPDAPVVGEPEDST